MSQNPSLQHKAVNSTQIRHFNTNPSCVEVTCWSDGCVEVRFLISTRFDILKTYYGAWFQQVLFKSLNKLIYYLLELSTIIFLSNTGFKLLFLLPMRHIFSCNFGCVEVTCWSHGCGSERYTWNKNILIRIMNYDNLDITWMHWAPLSALR